MKVIKFAPGLIPVLKHGTHDQKTHGNWAHGSSWQSGSQDGQTMFIYKGDKGKLTITIQDEIANNPEYKDAIDNFVKRVEEIQNAYPLPDLEILFSEGESTSAGHMATTYSASLDGIPQSTRMDFSEAILKNPVGGGLAEYVLAHEWGHGLDTRTRETAKEQGARFSQAKFEDDSIPMTDYGWSSDREAYAEAFAVKYNNSHRGGVWSANVEQTDKWEEVFKIFELDSVKKAKGERVSFLVKDTFDANNPPVLIENYAPPVLKHEEHDQKTHGSWATGQKGGSGLSHREMYALKKQPDPLASKVYAAEEKHHNQIQDKSTPAPTAPNRADFTEYSEYDAAYKKYSKDFLAWSKKVTTDLISPMAKKHLDGTPRGVNSYVRDVIRQDWFVEAFGKGGVAGNNLDVFVTSSGEAGAYQIGFKGDLPISNLRINRGYTKAEPTIIHEIAHYATTISATSPHGGHGVEFARNHIFIAGKVMGQEFADGLEKAYREAGIPLGD